MSIYIAGPMTGLPDFNYPAFHKAAAVLRASGSAVENPAEHFDGDQTLSRGVYIREAITALMRCDCVVALPGWRTSKGARLEISTALELGLPVYEWFADTGSFGPRVRSLDDEPTTEPVPPRASALNEAASLITGDRNNQYGPPTQDFTRTAKALSAMGFARVLPTDETVDLSASDVALMIAMVKISRLMHQRDKRDNWVDLAGYAGCGYECAVEESQNA